jgi:tRNA nucleotidyltransferase/poly(A) polymerase
VARRSFDPSGENRHHRPKNDDDFVRDEWRSYAGRWIALIDGRVVAQGGTPSHALQAARAARYKEIPQVSYVPTTEPFVFSPRLEQISSILPPDISVYMVGGAVRDALLARDSHTRDLDFVLAGNAINVGRKVADALGAAFYPLDESRDTARVISIQPDGERLVLDFAVFRGPDLEGDLRARDFTINAIAVDIRQPYSLLDPMGGVADLRAKRLRACSLTTFQDDPLRILRGVRFAAELEYRILPESLHQMREAVAELHLTSSERIRDELMRIMGGPRVGAAVRALDLLGVLNITLPELQHLKGMEQPTPHVYDAWEHTLNTLNKLDTLLSVLASQNDPEGCANLMTGLISVKLGRFRNQINAYLDTYLTPYRSSRELLFLAALYHDAGKPQTYQLDSSGRIHFFNHEKVGSGMISDRGSILHLSNTEVRRLKKIVRHHLRPLHLAQTGKRPSRRAVYRFFRDAGEAGVDICLLSLADVWATYGSSLPQGVWIRHLDIVRILLEAWWERSNERVSPPALLNGNDLINEFHLNPGPEIGILLEKIREAQVVGSISSRGDALKLARDWLANIES